MERIANSDSRPTEATSAIDFQVDPSAQEASRPFIGRWNQLVSTTNWEKGRIICQWRDALRASGAPVSQYADDTWGRLVGGVTGQHVGRLRRVHQRFGEVHEQFEGLYWSHFQSALEWEDAEMWLEGAIQNSWSVAQMRDQRWQTLGAPAELKPREEDVIGVELDEDVDAAVDSSNQSAPEESALPDTPPAAERSAPREVPSEAEDTSADGPEQTSDESAVAAEPVRPFENLAELPEDLAIAFEAFKLAIVRHRADHWQAISRDDLLATLDALKQLAQAPPVDEPF